MNKALTYKASGVDTGRTNRLVKQITKLMRRTYDHRVIDYPGGFAGLFSLAGANRRYCQPVLVGCTDGVGTKLKIAFMMDKHDTVGIDLVAMSVNDLVVQGAEPLFFLDYIATSQADNRVLLELIKGIARGCKMAGCALLGGETAEMPGFYKNKEYDLAGFVVGMVDKNRIINGRAIKPGDAVIGLKSNGLHSNGYSLVRKIFFEKRKLSIKKYIPELKTTLGKELLKPTRIYVKPILDCLARYRRTKAIKGIIHITGGGLLENIPRVLPRDTAVEIDKNDWPTHNIFKLIKKLGHVPEREMYRVFNMGLGLVLITKASVAKTIIRRLEDLGEAAYLIGKVVRGKKGVKIR